MGPEESDTFYSIQRDVHRYMAAHGFHERQVVVDLDAEFGADHVDVYSTIGPNPALVDPPVPDDLDREYRIDVVSELTPQETYDEGVSELEEDLDDVWIRST